MLGGGVDETVMEGEAGSIEILNGGGDNHPAEHRDDPDKGVKVRDSGSAKELSPQHVANSASGYATGNWHVKSILWEAVQTMYNFDDKRFTINK